ncbi:MAG: YeeE/YedE thiosulfate transporter family protein [Candidatus Magnetobacterium sp. LHC-1]|uniref:YeeE/YedE family protein n=1 Tax=Candidatus Magnetobacterium casense TaxID=1455061 RepID=A0ABS6S0X9_9BACT|nr:YeeE/YedE thiosulfate transporter family protein [Candidatus Magnetobacterium casensis]MBF0608725.1 YeeE/YedE family protein [Nitrospirota bacterium]MBV6342250.1 YeeE/YedE family protein [Candidatus Magnetobacterium casensis]
MQLKDKYGVSKTFIVAALVLLIAGAGVSFHLRQGWPLVVLFSILVVSKPAWWSMLILGLVYTIYLHSGWPLLGSVFFALLGKPKRWWPIPAGIAFALVEVLSFYLSERPLGITRGYTVMGAIATKVIDPKHLDKVDYWSIYEPYIDWTIALIMGTIIGSFLSARYSGDFRLNAVPELWKQSRGKSVAGRWLWVFLAGIMMGFAARIGGGCISGMLISGAIQLAPSGFIFMMSVWTGGVFTTFLFYRSRTIVVRRED